MLKLSSNRREPHLFKPCLVTRVYATPLYVTLNC